MASSGGAQSLRSERTPSPVPRPLSGLRAAGAFLRAELASSRERVRATARIVVSCAIATVVIASLQIPSGAWVIISIFLVSLPNAGATLRKGLQRLLGTIASCATGMVCVAAFADMPWVRVPLGGFAAGLAIFLFRTTTAPYSAILGGITFVMFFLNPTVEPEALVAFGLWRALLVATGVLIVLVVDLLLLPTDPERQLLDDLGRRLDAIEAVLRRLLASYRAEPATATADTEPAARLRGMVVTGLPKEIDLLADAEARHRVLRDRHPEQIVLITAVERLATEALGLSRLSVHAGAAEPPGELRERLAAIADGVAAVRRAVAARRAALEAAAPIAAVTWLPPVASEPAVDPAEGESAAALLASVVEMEAALRLAARALGVAGGPGSPPRSRADELSSPLDAPESGYFTPSFSLSNRADLQLALKAGLAEVLVYLFMVGADWPGIQTGLVTVLVIAGASNGAIVHKAVLRCSGAVLGGLVGLIATVAFIPIATSLAGFLPIAVACYAVAAWVTTGGPRISYAGVQAGIALALTLADTLGPSIDLTVARDRVVGIVIADMLTTLVFYAIWPVFATRGMRRALSDTVAALARFSRVGSRLEREELVRPARGFRWQIYQGLAATESMHDEAAFEGNSGMPEVRAARAGVRRLLTLAQDAMIAASAVVRHRVDVDLSIAPDHLADPLRALSAALGRKLDAISARIAGSAGAGPDAAPAEPAPLLAALERALAEALDRHAPRAPGDPETALLAHVSARVALQRELVAVVDRLDRETSMVAPGLHVLG